MHRSVGRSSGSYAREAFGASSRCARRGSVRASRGCSRSQDQRHGLGWRRSPSATPFGERPMEALRTAGPDSRSFWELPHRGMEQRARGRVLLALVRSKSRERHSYKSGHSHARGIGRSTSEPCSCPKRPSTPDRTSGIGSRRSGGSSAGPHAMAASCMGVCARRPVGALRRQRRFRRTRRCLSFGPIIAPMDEARRSSPRRVPSAACRRECRPVPSPAPSRSP